MGEKRGTDPIRDDEVLLRRILTSENWYDPQTGKVELFAFRPRKSDVDGLSLARADFGSAAEEAARGRKGKEYWVAILTAADARARNIVIEPDPQPNSPGHARIPSLTYANRKSDASMETQRALAEMVVDVKGPLPGMTEPPK